ncbi:MAG: hypothetical protein WCE75_01800, partial [Terracidiphilus sp.]
MSLSKALAVLLSFAAAASAVGQGTRLWTQSRLEEFEKGTPAGVTLTSDGQLREGPGLVERLTTPSSYVWSVAVDKAGTAYLGTGMPASVLRMGAAKGDKPFTLFETRELTVQVVRVGPDGAVYAATLPGGRVYRLKSDAQTKLDEASATLIFDATAAPGGAVGKSGQKSPASDPKSFHPVWDMTFDAAGRLYIATGAPAAVFRVDPAKPAAAAEKFFESDEQHIRALAWDGQGNLLAGTDGSGLVYRISPAGKGYVLFEAPRREITALAVSAGGTVYAASVGEKNRNPLPPLPVQGQGSVTITYVQPGSMQVANASASLPEGTEIFALKEGQAPRRLWAGKDDIVYALRSRPDGLLAVTGNRGRILRIADDGSYADLGHLEAQQGLSLAEAEGGVLVGTGNTGKLVCLCAAERHEYASDVFDAGAMARFGRVEADPESAGFEVLT